MPGQNDFPSPDNYQQTSFPQPVVAPDVDPDEGSLLTVQYSAAWVEVLMAAVDQLLQYGTWQGTSDDKITAVNRAESLKWMLQEPASVTTGIPTPFWDEASDVDDEEEPAIQTWYGYVDDPELPPGELTFFEDATIWVFTGFLALSGTPAAAILFHTLAPRFTLAMRGGDFGEVIRILMDGQDMATVDTTGMAGELIEIPIVGDEGISLHDLMLIKVS